MKTVPVLRKKRHILLKSCFCIVMVVAAISFMSGESGRKEKATATKEKMPIPPVVISPDIPVDVSIPTGSTGNPIAFFDDFSWRSFIALAWPARNGQRGEPDRLKALEAAGPRVFETYKNLAEVFHNDGSEPAAWNDYDSVNACFSQTQFGDLVFASFSKFSNLGQAGIGKLVGPLVSQNKTYVRYLTAFNRIEFDQILSQKLYLRVNLQNPVTFNDGAIDIKSSWIDMKNITHPERYYTRMAIVMDPDSGFKCSVKLVGLVGLHIVQKTPSRPQWIWSTFEHIDNIPQQGAQAPFAFHNGDATPMPAKNPFTLDPLTIPTPGPFNVERLPSAPIHISTQQTNAAYRGALQQRNSVWQFYQLVMTQWPLQMNPPAPIPASQPGTPQFTFPGTGATSAFANVTMETFDQANIRSGCMNCHNFTKKTDFLWALNDHAFPATVPNLAPNMAIRNLKKTLEAAEKESIKKFNIRNNKHNN